MSSQTGMFRYVVIGALVGVDAAVWSLLSRFVG